MRKLCLTILIVSLLALPMSALALEKISGSDLSGVVGQAGVTIAFGGTATTTISFSQLSWGDPDGLATTCGNNAGWLIIDGDITIQQVIACGQTLTLDIGTTGGAPCSLPPCSVIVPAATTFIAVGMPTTTLSISVPQTLTIGLGNAAGTITGTLGILNLRSLSVDAGTPTNLYIWAH
jgi:hypothetical protein